MRHGEVIFIFIAQVFAFFNREMLCPNQICRFRHAILRPAGGAPAMRARGGRAFWFRLRRASASIGPGGLLLLSGSYGSGGRGRFDSDASSFAPIRTSPMQDVTKMLTGMRVLRMGQVVRTRMALGGCRASARSLLARSWWI